MVFAILTWISVNLQYDYTITKMIPVVLENPQEGRALKYPVPKHLTIRFSGNGWLLAALSLSPDVKYYIDVAALSETPFVLTGRDVLEHVKLPVPVHVIDVKPDSLLLALDEYEEKRVPVLSHLTFGFRKGYGQVAPMNLQPESVTVTGARTQLAALTGWPTVYRRFDDLRGPVNVEIPLEESQYHSFDIHQKSVRVAFDVQAFAEQEFSDIAINVKGIPSNREVVLIPSRLSIIVRGPIDQLAKLSSQQFHSSVAYGDLAADSAGFVVPSLESKAGVQIVNRKPDRVQFIIRKR